MFAVDDDLESSPKHEALDGLPPQRRARAFEAWLRLGAACRKRGNGGLLTVALVDKILHAWKPMERAQTLVDLVEARGGRSRGLLVAEGDGWRFHEWERWQPDEHESKQERESVSKKSLRQRRWRHKKRLGGDAEETDRASTPVDVPASTVDVSEASPKASTATPVDASRALRAPATRVRVPDPVPIPTLPYEIQGGDLDQVARAPEPGPVGRRSLEAETIRRALAEAFKDASVTMPRSVRDIDGKHWHALVDPVREIAARDGQPIERVAARLAAGFLASPRARKAHWPIAFLAENPGEYLATRTEVSDFSHVDPSVNVLADDD